MLRIFDFGKALSEYVFSGFLNLILKLHISFIFSPDHDVSTSSAESAPSKPRGEHYKHRRPDISKQQAVAVSHESHKRKRSTEASSEDEGPSTSRTNNEQKKKTVTKAGVWGEKNSASSDSKDPKRMKMIAPLPLPQVWPLTHFFCCFSLVRNH